MNGLKFATAGIGAGMALVIGCQSALADCTCRSRDVVANEGEVVCLTTPLGQRLARCDKVLNNSSWTFLQAACPTASLTLAPVRHALVSHAPVSHEMARLQNPVWAAAAASQPISDR